jgi:hypothetical protein
MRPECPLDVARMRRDEAEADALVGELLALGSDLGERHDDVVEEGAELG